MILKIRNFFRGKKTFILGALMITLGIMQNNNELIMEGILALTIRAGINNAVDK